MKHLLISLIVISIVLSVFTGLLAFRQTNGNMYKSFNEIENIEWIIPLDSSYSGIYKISDDDNNSWYLASTTIADTDNVTYEILDDNFRKQSVYDDYYLYTEGNKFITICTGTGILGRDVFNGLMNSKGEEILPPIYVDISEPKDGYLAATYIKNNKTPSLVFFTEDGKRLFSEENVTITDTSSIINAGNGIFAIVAGSNHGKATIYDAKSKSIIKVIKDVLHIKELKNGFYATKTPSGETPVSIYDRSFNYIKTLPDNLFAPHSFSEGKAIISKTAYYKDDASYVCVDENFNSLFEIFASQDAVDFSEGKSICYNKENFFCIDAYGNVLYEKSLAKQFKDIPFFTLYDCIYKNGEGIVYDGIGFGIVDERGNWIVDPIFSSLKHASDDTYIATIGNLEVGVFRIKN